jgi:hypothetical protein
LLSKATNRCSALVSLIEAKYEKEKEVGSEEQKSMGVV